METDETDLRDQLCSAAHQLWQRGLVSGGHGTLTAELHRRRYLVTPQSRRKATLQPDDLVTVDLQGIDQNGGRNTAPLMWAPHHIALNHGLRQTAEDIGTGRGRDIRATALAFPPKLLAFAAHAQAAKANGIKLRGHAPVPIIDGNDEKALLAAIKSYAVIVLPEHGVFATGSSLNQVLSTLEDTEAAAELTLTLQLLHPPSTPS
ncbi:MAG: class II aldolase/adducin family protein [Algisphaera sp.]